MKALASQGLLGLIIPKEFGGMGQNHVCMAMVVETIARYGCPSTAMVCGEYHQCQQEPEVILRFCHCKFYIEFT